MYTKFFPSHTSQSHTDPQQQSPQTSNPVSPFMLVSSPDKDHFQSVVGEINSSIQVNSDRARSYSSIQVNSDRARSYSNSEQVYNVVNYLFI